MTKTATGWRRIGGLMAALVLAVLAFGPGLDAYICRNEAVHSAPAASTAPEAAQHVDVLHADAGHAEHGDGGLCSHGHCHHAVFFITPLPAQVGETQAVTQRPTPLRASVALSDLQFGFMRPPRA